MKKKRLAACVMALTMSFASISLAPELFSKGVVKNSIVAEAVNSADGKYKYRVLDEASKTARMTGFLNAGSDLTVPSKIDGYTITEYGNLFTTSTPKVDARNVMSVTFEEGVTRIPSNVFKGCMFLTKVTFPSTLKSIDKDAFSGCTALIKEVDGLQYVNNWLVGVSSDSITSATVRAGTVGVADGVFSGCTKLRSLDLTALSTIPARLCNGCTALSDVKVSSNLIRIGDEAFQNTAITSFTIPSSVTSIGENAFTDTPMLQSISSSVKISDGWLLTTSRSESSVTVASNVKHIADGAFSGNTALSSVTFQNGLETIGSGAFRGCSSLSSVTFPSTLTRIEDNAFYGCIKGTDKGLTSISLPSGISYIGSGAFQWTRLESATINNMNCVLGDMCFGYGETSANKDTDFTVNCYENSTAHAYAQKNDLKISLLQGSGTHVHTYGDWVITKAATCIADGSRTRTCSGCGASQTETLKATGVHSYGDWKVTTAATCGADGTQERTCSVCKKTETQTIKATGAHTFAVSKVVAPTTTSQGYTVYRCTVCGKTENRDYTDPISQTKTSYSITLKTTTASNGESTKYANSAVTLKFAGSSTKTMTSSNKTFTVPDGLADGSYTLTVSAANFVTRTYNVTVKSGNLTADPKVTLQLYGDPNGDGKISSLDIIAVKRYLIKQNKLGDYEISCANADKNSVINSLDIIALKRHIIKARTIW